VKQIKEFAQSGYFSLQMFQQIVGAMDLDAIDLDVLVDPFQWVRITRAHNHRHKIRGELSWSAAIRDIRTVVRIEDD
jgi:hypothetical protein